MTLRVLARQWRSYWVAGSTVGTRSRKHADWKAASILHPQLESEAMVCGSLTATTHTYSTITNTAAACVVLQLPSVLTEYLIDGCNGRCCETTGVGKEPGVC